MSIIIADYSVGEVIASGEYFSVRMATHIPTGRPVAAKFVNERSARAALEQSVVEVNILKAINNSKNNNNDNNNNNNSSTATNNCFHNSSNVVSLIDSFPSVEWCEHNRRHTSSLTILEYASRQDVCDHLLAGGHFDESSSAVLFIQLLNAISTVHEAGFVHRDLKPEQLVFDRLFNIKLIDFGLAAPIQPQQQQQQNQRVGTNMYMAPEVFSRSPYSRGSTVANDAFNRPNCVPNADIAVDMYGVGICLFLFLFGFPPFVQASSQCALYRAFSSGELNNNMFWNRVQSRRSSPVSKEAIDLINKLMTNKPQDRINAKEARNHPWIKKFTVNDDNNNNNNNNSNNVVKSSDSVEFKSEVKAAYTNTLTKRWERMMSTKNTNTQQQIMLREQADEQAHQQQQKLRQEEEARKRERIREEETKKAGDLLSESSLECLSPISFVDDDDDDDDNNDNNNNNNNDDVNEDDDDKELLDDLIAANELLNLIHNKKNDDSINNNNNNNNNSKNGTDNNNEDDDDDVFGVDEYGASASDDNNSDADDDFNNNQNNDNNNNNNNNDNNENDSIDIDIDIVGMDFNDVNVDIDNNTDKNTNNDNEHDNTHKRARVSI